MCSSLCALESGLVVQLKGNKNESWKPFTVTSQSDRLQSPPIPLSLLWRLFSYLLAFWALLCNAVYYGVNRVPLRKDILETSLLGPQDMTLFGNAVVADVIR